MQAFLDTARWWADAVGAFTGGDECCGGRGRSRACVILRDTLAPAYFESQDEALEIRRLGLGCALLGQLAVVACRLITGNLSGGVVGLVIFALGSHARSSLDRTTISGFAIVGVTVGAMDFAFLVQQACLLKASFFALPWQANLAHNLTGVAKFCAPPAELLSAKLALELYPSRPSRCPPPCVHAVAWPSTPPACDKSWSADVGASADPSPETSLLGRMLSGWTAGEADVQARRAEATCVGCGKLPPGGWRFRGGYCQRCWAERSAAREMSRAG